MIFSSVLLKTSQRLSMLPIRGYFVTPKAGSYAFRRCHLFSGIQDRGMSTNEGWRHIDYNQLMTKKQKEAAVVIDVREKSELEATGVIPDSINIPLQLVESALQLSPDEFKKTYGAEKPSPDSQIIFSCRAGSRSIDAMSKALKHGYKNALNFTGGWLDWERQNN